MSVDADTEHEPGVSVRGRRSHGRMYRRAQRDSVVAVAVAGSEEESDQVKREWDDWSCGVPIEVLLDRHR